MSGPGAFGTEVQTWAKHLQGPQATWRHRTAQHSIAEKKCHSAIAAPEALVRGGLLWEHPCGMLSDGHNALSLVAFVRVPVDRRGPQPALAAEQGGPPRPPMPARAPPRVPALEAAPPPPAPAPPPPAPAPPPARAVEAAPPPPLAPAPPAPRSGGEEVAASVASQVSSAISDSPSLSVLVALAPHVTPSRQTVVDMMEALAQTDVEVSTVGRSPARGVGSFDAGGRAG